MLQERLIEVAEVDSTVGSGKDGAESRAASATPSGSSTTSDDMRLPHNLATEEMQLALNKEAGEEELFMAIGRCRELVLHSDECSTERKWLVRHLIELRLRLQECKEAKADPQHPRNKSSGVSKRTICGHHFVLQPLLRSLSSNYCDHCTGSIWSVIQAWYRCDDCGYVCHHKCLSEIVRECAHVTASERGGYELDICPERGLSAQKYRCAECKVTLPLDNTWSEARKCDYTGLYYCAACHWGSSAVIPARVVHNWDFEPQLVCQASLQLLRLTARRPLVNIERHNPQLFALVHELSLVKRLRLALAGMRRYLLVCRTANEERLLRRHVDDAPHLVESPDLYSLQDLVDTHTAELPSRLHAVAHAFGRHIKETCVTCQGRGHICEVCSNDEVLFPFDDNAVSCNDCGVVLHKACSARRRQCPKCERLRKRREEIRDAQDEPETESLLEDNE